MTRWRLLTEPRPPAFKCAVGFYVSARAITLLLLLFWSVTWTRREDIDTRTFDEMPRDSTKS